LISETTADWKIFKVLVVELLNKDKKEEEKAVAKVEQSSFLRISFVQQKEKNWASDDRSRDV
jgi:hypothetical protein